MKLFITGYGKILEIGRLEADSKILPLSKTLVLTHNMNEVCHVLKVKINGILHNIRVFEEHFQADFLILPLDSFLDNEEVIGDHRVKVNSDTRSDVDLMFEEEFIVPSMADIGDEKGLEDERTAHVFSYNCQGGDDNELDDLLSSFQQLSNIALNQPPKLEKNKKFKSKNKNLIVGGQSSQVPLSSQDVNDDDSVIHFIVERISNTVETSGGIVTLWNSSVFSMEQKLVERNYLCIIVRWVGISGKVGILDLPIGERRFTRFDREGKKAIKLDIFLVSKKFFEVWNDAFVSVMCRLISDHCPIRLKNHTTFIVGRQILDACLFSNEIIRMTNIEKHKLLLFKVDFKNAFDSINWNFLQDVMRKMGFMVRWRKWIGAYLSLASISVLVNGSPSNEFKMKRSF
nr:cysteine-rich receptor-like protein kinase [Tanacetum cinerariifolium]